MQELKALFNSYIKLKEKEEQIYCELDAKLNEEIYDDELETEWDKAYEEEYKAFKMLVNKLVTYTNNQIDEDTAKMMLSTKMNALVDIVSRIA